MKKTICLFGGSGTMGFETFKVLWNRRHKLSLRLLLRPSEKNKKLFSPFIRKAGPDQLKIIWGDASVYKDVRTAVEGSDSVLDAMAFISPQADYYPETAQKVNITGISNIVRAIGEEPDGNARIRLAYTGTVAATGDRLPPIHWGRTGDPLKPSLFDYYAVTKIAGERLVLESEIKHWVSLRMTYIMPMNFKGLLGLTDPIMFHMPLNSCMENISSIDAGVGLANVTDISKDSTFWRRVYNMGGGSEMRMTAMGFMDSIARLFGGNGIRNASERHWYATQNFHMQYYADSGELNKYLDFQKTSYSRWQEILLKTLPAGMKMLRTFAAVSGSLRRKIDQETRKRYEKMVFDHRNGTGLWRRNNVFKRLDSFFGGEKIYDAIPGWDEPLPKLHTESEPQDLLEHGYDETKISLDAGDLMEAAKFRGGSCKNNEWTGDMFEPVKWECAFGHRFTAKPNTILKGGHWCPECEAPDWDFQKIAAKNPFFNQVIEPFAKLIPTYPITIEDLNDISKADRD